MADQPNQVTLKSNDGKLFKIERDIALEFGALKAMLEEKSFAESFIPLHNVGKSELTTIIQYCRKHIEFRADPNDRSGDATAFNEAFVENLTLTEIGELILAANYLDHRKLFDLLCCTVANKIKDKSVTWVRNLFGLKNDFTTEEEKALRDQYAWAHEGVEDD